MTKSQSTSRKADAVDEAPAHERKASSRDAAAVTGQQALGNTHMAARAAQRRGGQPLPDAVRSRFEGALGADLSGVRVHTDAGSASGAEAMQANAYAQGQDIHGPQDRLDPGSKSGMETLAHEVIHTVQSQRQGGDGGVMTSLKAVSSSSDGAEQEAQRGASQVAAGRSFQVSAAPTAQMSRNSATVRAVIDDATKTAEDVIAAFAAEDPSWVGHFFRNAGNRAAAEAKLNGNQIIGVIRRLPNGWLAAEGLDRVNIVRAAGGAGGTQLQTMVAAFPTAWCTGIYGDATAMTFLRGLVQAGPLSLFAAERNGLSNDARDSDPFMKWFIAASTPAEILRLAASSGGAAAMVARLTALGGERDWLAELPTGAGLTTEQQNQIIVLRDAAPAGSAEFNRLNGHLASAPLATSAEDAKVQLDALLMATDMCPSPAVILTLVGQLDEIGKADIAGRLAELHPHLSPEEFGQLCRLLGFDLAMTLDKLKDVGIDNPTIIMDTIRPAPLDQRKAVAGNQTRVTWISGICTDLPFSVFAAAETERRDFVQQAPFFAWMVGRYPGTELLNVLGAADIISDAARALEGRAAETLTWLEGLPAKDVLSEPHKLTLRGFRLVWTDATLTQWVDDYFEDATSPNEHATQSSAPADESVYESALTRLNAALDDSDDTLAIQMCGALQGDELTRVRANENGIIQKIGGELEDEEFYHAMRALGLEPKWQMWYLAEVEGGENQARFQAIITTANQDQLNAIVGWNDLVDHIEDEIDGDPLAFFGFQAGIPGWALTKTRFMEWVVEDTAPLEILRVLGSTRANAEAAASALDAIDDGWDWLDDLPDEAMALTLGQRQMLGWLETAMSDEDGKERIADILSDDEDECESPADALEALLDELDDFNVDEERCMRLVTQLDASGRQEIRDNHRDEAVGAFNAAEMARFVTNLGMPIGTQLEWLQAAGTPSRADLQRVLNSGTPGDWAALFDDTDVAEMCADVLDVGPSLALPGLSTVLATVTPKEAFWTWVLDASDELEVLRLAGTGGAVATSMTHIASIEGDKELFDDLPRGSGLASSHRPYADTVMRGCADGEWQKKIFVLRWDADITGDWTGDTPDDLLRLYNNLVGLPLEHVVNNRFLEVFNRHHNGGGTYNEGGAQINIGADPAQDTTLYEGTPNQYTGKKFDSTTRHEVGHAVDALLGGRTTITFDWAGWFEYGEGQCEQWVDAMGGWNDMGGGPPPTADEKRQILEALRSFMNSAAGSIGGPGGSIFDMVGPDHPLKTRADLAICRNLTAAGGKMTYTNVVNDGSHIWSMNYYYQRWMKVKSLAGANVPRDYSLFAPAEWFADMYSEYYRQYDGTPATEASLGGNVPGHVKSWFDNNVHTVGNDPHNRRDAGGPVTGIHGSG